MSHLIAAVDESMRANAYLLCATVVSTADRPHLRRSLRGLLALVRHVLTLGVREILIERVDHGTGIGAARRPH